MKTINLNQLAFRWYILAFISIIVISPLNAQKTLYVANPPLGNDNNDGTSIDTPFENIQKALDEAVSGVTTSIQVMGGTYKERLTWKQPGTANAPMILTNYSGQTVILDGKNATG